MQLNIKKAFWGVLYAITIILLLISCKSKETLTERTIQRDTLIQRSHDYKSLPISTTITIDEICDSLGNVRKFTQVETSGLNKAKVFTKDNTLNIDLLTGLSRFKTDTIYKTEFKDVYKDKEVIKYRTPFKTWLIIIAMGVIILLLLGFKLRF